MIKVLSLNEKYFSQFQISNTPNFLIGLSHINALIGVNNSGKSRFMRAIFSAKDAVTYYAVTKESIANMNKLVSNLKSSINASVQYARNYQFNFKSEDEIILAFESKNISTIINTIKQLDKITNNEFEHPDPIASQNFNRIKDQFLSPSQNLYTHLHPFQIGEPKKKLYIPILRGLRPIQQEEQGNKFNNRDSFLNRTTFDYFKNLPASCNIYTGLTIYEDVMKLLLGEEHEREVIHSFESFLSNEIFKEKITLIPKYKEDVLHIKIGDDKQFEIYNLGDGLQTLIAILFPIHLSKEEETIVFIEEPEAHLHPKWQALLINSLRKFTKHTFFISTHSSAFINSEDTSMYSFIKQGSKSQVNYINLVSEKAEVVRNLGYKPSDLLQTNFILWVEGPSDRIYINYWIHLKDKSLVEGLHYSIMYYGGSNYNSFLKDGKDFNLDFIKSLNQNFGIIIDSDRKKDKEKYDKRKLEIKDLFMKNNHYCWLTRRREIENYIPYNVFVESVKEYHQKTEIEIGKTNFCDRNTVIELNAKKEYKSTIRLPDSIFSIIQKNKDGSTKGLNAIELRKGLEEAVKATQKVTFQVRKVEVAKTIVKKEPLFEDTELQNEINLIVKKIRKANDLLLTTNI